jgi:CheY-like chemotaxis protein
MPDMGGFDVLKQLETLGPDLAVLIFSMNSEDQYVERALALGASGYLTKDSMPRCLARFVKRSGRSPPGTASRARDSPTFRARITGRVAPSRQGHPTGRQRIRTGKFPARGTWREARSRRPRLPLGAAARSSPLHLIPRSARSCGDPKVGRSFEAKPGSRRTGNRANSSSHDGVSIGPRRSTKRDSDPTIPCGGRSRGVRERSSGLVPRVPFHTPREPGSRWGDAPEGARLPAVEAP